MTESDMTDVDGAENYDSETLFLGYLLGRKNASTKAQDVLNCEAFDDVKHWEAAKDLEKRFQDSALALRALREAKKNAK